MTHQARTITPCPSWCTLPADEHQAPDPLPGDARMHSRTISQPHPNPRFSPVWSVTIDQTSDEGQPGIYVETPNDIMDPADVDALISALQDVKAIIERH